MSKIKVFWFDTETSGINEKENSIIQLAAMIEIDGKLVAEKEFVMNPKTLTHKRVDQQALNVNGYTMKDIESFPPIHRIQKRIARWMNKFVDPFDKTDKFYAGGYNVQFDIKFLQQLFIETGDKFFWSYFFFPTIDPSQILAFLEYAGKIPPFKDHKLTTVAKHFGVLEDNAHDAMVDVRMTRNITLELLKLLGE